MRAAPLLAILLACAPTIEGPAERQRARDRDDADRLGVGLAQLPGAVRAEVWLRRGSVEPFTGAASPTSVAALVVIDDHADRDVLAGHARNLVRAAVPEVAAPAIVIARGAPRPRLAAVGPFTVEAGSRRRLVAAIAAAFAALAGLGAWVAWHERRRIARG